MNLLDRVLTFRLIVLTVVLAVLLAIWGPIQDRIQKASSPEVVQLSCSENFRELPLAPGGITIIVPPGDCWGEKLVVPFQVNHLLIRPTNTVWERVTFPDGTEEEFEYSPLLRKKDTRLITGVRFKNLHKEPVPVKITY